MTASVQERLHVLREACRLAAKEAALDAEAEASWTGDHWECSWAKDLDEESVGELDVCFSGRLDPGTDVAIVARVTRKSGEDWSARHPFAPLPAVEDAKALNRWREYLTKALGQLWEDVRIAWSEKRAHAPDGGVEALRSLARPRKTG